MANTDNDDEPSTVMLKAPLMRQAGGTGPVQEMTSTGKLVCTSPQLLDPGQERELWLTRLEETLGRGDQCTIRILSPDLSRLHARVSAFSNTWVIEDCDSRNGVWVNEVRVESRSKISSGDIVKLGRVPFRFEILDVAPSELVEAVAPEPPRTSKTPSAYPDDTIPLELSDTGELVDMSALEPQELELPAAPQPDESERREKLVARAGLIGVPVKEADAGLENVAAEVEAALPEILSTLLGQARQGDADAARACLHYHLERRRGLPASLRLDGSFSERVQRTLAAMTDHSITPAQALEVLQTLETARRLLGAKRG